MSARAWRVAVALAGAACGLVALAALLGGELREPAADAIPEVVVGWSFIAAGIVAMARRPGSRAGLLMVAIGFAWLVRELQYVESGLAHTLGMFVEGFQWLLLAHLLATFPTGRPQDRLERATLVAIYVFAVPNAFGTLPYEESRPPDCPDCPANVLSIAPDAGVADAVHAGMAAGTVLIAALVLVCFVRRWRRASPSGRRAFTPVLAGTVIVFAVAFAGAIATGPLEELPDWVTQLAFLSLAAGLLAGLLRAWLDRQALGDLVLRLGQASTPARLRALLARALHDPTVELLYWDDERATYVDEAGRERSPDAVAGGRAVTLLGSAERPGGALLHDPLLLDDPVLVHAVGEAARLAVENGRLQSEVRAQVRELRASRQRIAEAAISERRKVERDLHDGAQQRLISLSLALAMAEERAAETSGADLAELRELA